MTHIMGKATKIRLFDFKSPQMRTFHLTWLAFFLAFFGWFGIAPLMVYVREELQLTPQQIGSTIIASVGITIVARLFIGWLCDKIGPRIAYSFLLIGGSLPVMGIGLSENYESFLLFRLAIGVIGASFVITQYHTSIMFAPNVVGTANATTAGWGNLGGGVTQMVMPLIFALIASLGVTSVLSWRYAMVVPGVALFLMGIVYFFFTQDTPEGNFSDIKKKRRLEGVDERKGHTTKAFLSAVKDYRVWALFVIYGACFGIELTINNIAALYYKDNFSLDPKTAGIVAGLFGLMNLFARTLGGYFGDIFGKRNGLKGRVAFLGVVIFFEGIFLILFSQMGSLALAIGSMILFSLFVQMSEGATYSVVPFINKKALGAVSGIVGAGGNAGAVAAGFLFRSNPNYAENLFILGMVVAVTSTLALVVRFSEADEKEMELEMEGALSS
ncbi:MAG: NarK family nitrate/nitrite MFS transporter [Spirochaetia bacterium]|nr:NarK family nitrate/nitrite MFS transporter [Spirochaetia bacterium]